MGDEHLKQPLELVLQSRRLNVQEALLIAKDLCARLCDLHAAGRVHGNLWPGSVTYDPEARCAVLGDLAEHAGPGGEVAFSPAPSDLAYVAPERTGRLQGACDGRADLYSLGAILYLLLVGRPPFGDTDPLELMHAVMAKVPLAPRALVPDIPQPIDDIVMTLLRKTPEERYASASGLLADLSHCLFELDEFSTIAAFPLRTHDVGKRLELPVRLYGRSAEMAAVRELFTAVQHGEKRLLLVSGGAGTGKSSLVRECHAVFTQAQGVFVEGKFDSYRRDAPYVAWRLAIGDWTRQLLTQSPAIVELYRRKILEGVGSLGRVLTDVAPDLALVIGAQAEVYPLGGNEAQNRFNLVVSSFVRAIASGLRPLVLFQDDMQWADPASLALLETLLTDTTISGLFVIGAYRPLEVDVRHPLTITLERLTARGARATTIPVGNLVLEEVAALLSDALQVDPSKARELGKLICTKTAGNPFFVHRMLRVLAEDGLISFDAMNGRWSFSTDAIAGAQVADSVVDLLVRRMMRLSSRCRSLVARASLLGNSFTVKALAAAAAMGAEDVVSVLAEAADAGLLSVQGGLVRFAHDRIQQAAQSLVTPKVARALHLEVGRRLLAATLPGELDEHVYDIVNQLNEGESLMVDRQERTQLAELNLLAARKAKRAVAYASATAYLAAALRLLEDDRDGENYGLWLALTNEALEAHYLRVEFATALAFCADVDQAARNPVDRAKATIHRILIAVAQMHPEEALRIGVDFLAALGTAIRETPLVDVDPEAVLERPPMTDPRIMAAIDVLMNMLSSAYMVSSDVLVRICDTAIGLCMEHGSNPALAYVYAVYGIWACGVASDIERGYRWGKLALEAWQRFDARKDSAKVLHVFNNCIRFFKEPELDTIDETLAAVKYGLEYGDTETAGYASLWYSSHKVFACSQVEALVGPFNEFIAMNARHGMRLSEEGVRISRQVVANLLGDTADPSVLTGEFINEDQLRQRALPEASNRVLLYWLSVAKLYLSYLFGRYETALESAVLAKECETPAVGITVPFRFYHALACLEVAGQMPRDSKDVQVDGQASARRDALLARAQVCIERLQFWAGHEPRNFGHRLALVLAERARVLGQASEALGHYENACEGAARQGYTIDLALAHERLGRFQLVQGKSKLAALHLREAVAAYRTGGMRAKADHLATEIRRRIGSLTETLPAVLSGRTLDVDTIIKAARSFSSEIVMDALLRRILDVVVQSTGAQKGFLLLMNDGEPEVVAETRHDVEGVQLLQSTRVDDRSDLSAGIVHYVARTGRNVVLRDAALQGEFRDDPYVLKLRPRSVSCVPLTNLGRLSGIVYLENNLIANAFTEERSELLGVLSSLMATSLDNARLYGAIRDELSRRETVERELRRSEENLSVTLRSITEGVVTTDAEDRIVAMNPAAERITGFAAQQLLGRIYSDVIPETRSSDTTTIVDRGGIQRLIEGTLSPITDARGARVGSVRVLRDVTEKRQREAYFLQSQRLDIIGQLAGGIAHDFNNQLVAVMGYAELIGMRAAATHQAEIKADANTIVKAAQGAADLTRQLLMLGRKVEVEKTVFDVHETIHEAMSLLQRSLDKNVVVELALDADNPMIAGDQTFIQNAVLNIGLNAKDAMPSGGTLRVRTRGVVVPGERPEVDSVLTAGPYLRIVLEDTGSGMSPEVCRRVCEPFFTTKEKGRGTGLGLATAYATLRSHGGWLLVESVLGRGTTVTLYLPTATAAAAAATLPPEVVPADARRLRVLIADDEPSVRGYLKSLLATEGHEVLACSSGEEAVELYRAERPLIDCVILDMIMPGMGGKKAFEAIRQLDSAAQVVICTGYAVGDDLEQVLASGAVGVLRKPFYRDDILDLLRRASQPRTACPVVQSAEP